MIIIITRGCRWTSYSWINHDDFRSLFDNRSSRVSSLESIPGKTLSIEWRERRRRRFRVTHVLSRSQKLPSMTIFSCQTDAAWVMTGTLVTFNPQRKVITDCEFLYLSTGRNQYGIDIFSCRRRASASNRRMTMVNFVSIVKHSDSAKNRHPHAAPTLCRIESPSDRTHRNRLSLPLARWWRYHSSLWHDDQRSNVDLA